jgi:hypothetical protein
MTVLLAGMLSACAGLVGPRVITVSEADISRALERRMPMERRMLEVFDVRVSSPKVQLLPDSNRLATEFDLTVADRLSGRDWHTHLALDYALRYQAEDATIHLSQVHVRQLPGEADVSSRSVVRIGTVVAETLLEDLTVYRLRPEDLRTAQGLGLKPSAVTVTQRGIEIALAPVAP